MPVIATKQAKKKTTTIVYTSYGFDHLNPYMFDVYASDKKKEEEKKKNQKPKKPFTGFVFWIVIDGLLSPSAGEHLLMQEFRTTDSSRIAWHARSLFLSFPNPPGKQFSCQSVVDSSL